MQKPESSSDRDSLLRFSSESNADYRDRVARQNVEALEDRRQRLREQTSLQNTPERRIRIWEHLHALSLPRAAHHPLLAVVASQTGLTIEQVQEEQRHRHA
jgi:hypothetical protein